VAIFQRSIPATEDDFVVVSVRGLGTRKGAYLEKTWWRKINGVHIGGRYFTGIEVSTAAGLCGVLHLLLEGRLPQRGVVKMEQVRYRDFMASPFGRYYQRYDVQLAS